MLAAMLLLEIYRNTDVYRGLSSTCLIYQSSSGSHILYLKNTTMKNIVNDNLFKTVVLCVFVL